MEDEGGNDVNILHKSFVPKLAFDHFKEAENCWNETGSFSPEVLLTLHSYFGDALPRALELLDKHPITCYTTSDYQKIYAVSTNNESQCVFENINFCQCDIFRKHVVEDRDRLSCQHVLAVFLARITGQVKLEELSEDNFDKFMNLQLNKVLVND